MISAQRYGVHGFHCPLPVIMYVGSSQVGEDRCGGDAPTEEDKTKDSVEVGDISTPHSCDGRIEDKDKGSNSGLGLIGAYSDTDSDST